MEFGEVHMLVSLSEMLAGHPHLTEMKQLVDAEIKKHHDAAKEEVKKLQADAKAKEDAEAKKKAEADLRASRMSAPESPSVPAEPSSASVRNVHEGLPGPAERRYDPNESSLADSSKRI